MKTKKSKSKQKSKRKVSAHAKRILKITPKFVHGVVVGAIVGVFLVVGLRSTSPANAATTNSSDCGVEATNLVNGLGYFKSFSVAGNTATASIDVTGGSGCSEVVTIASWQAPFGSTNFQPYSSQKLIASKTETFKAGTSTLSIQLPSCDYQVDTLRGKSPYSQYGNADYVYPQVIDWLQAGNKVCEPSPSIVPPPNTTTTSAPPTTPTPAATTGSSTPTTLVNTGPGAVITIFVLAVLGGTIFHYTHRHVKHKRKAAHSHR